MTSELSIWFQGVPVIPSGDPEFAVWFAGVPVVDMGGVSGGGGIGIGTRIVSPRRERVNQLDFNLTPFHVRRVSPKIPVGRSPFYA